MTEEAKARKRMPIFSGVLAYFPDAIRELAQCSYIGNEQHQPGEPLHWAREKSKDHHDALLRHTMDSGTIDSDGIRHSIKALWRAAAIAQLEIEAANAAFNSHTSKDSSTPVRPCERL